MQYNSDTTALVNFDFLDYQTLIIRWASDLWLYTMQWTGLRNNLNGKHYKWITEVG